MKPTIFLTHDLFDIFESRLASLCNNEFEWIRIDFSNIKSQKQFFLNLDQVQVIINRFDLSKELYYKAKKLKLIQLPISGYDQIDLKQAKNLGIEVCNTSGANAISVSEHFFSLVLANYRNLLHHHHTVMNGDWINLKDYNQELFGKTLGIIGMGNIGKEIAKRAISFGMKILYFDIDETLTFKGNDIIKSSMDILLSNSDIVSFHVPLTNQTRKMINYDLLNKMKKNSILVNLARGEIQIEDDIEKALNNNIISGAILDVFSQEPYSHKSSLIKFGNKNYLRDRDNTKKVNYIKSPKAIFSPHSGPSKKTRERAISFIIENIRRLNSGLTLKSYCIDYD